MKTEMYKQYKEDWERRLKREEKSLERKRDLLIRKVKLCALMLKELGGKRVILFGSLVTGKFRKDSDVDIAVDGLSIDAYFKALGILEETLGDISFDLVDLKEALPSVIKRIEREGVQL